jgi:hypothetical protein
MRMCADRRADAQAYRKRATPIGDPGIDLEGVKLVVLVQPIWASMICTPIRSWLLAHRGQLAGTKLALLAANLGSSPVRLRANYDNEFGEVFRPLAAFAVVDQRLRERECLKSTDDFALALVQAGATLPGLHPQAAKEGG